MPSMCTHVCVHVPHVAHTCKQDNTFYSTMHTYIYLFTQSCSGSTVIICEASSVYVCIMHTYAYHLCSIVGENKICVTFIGTILVST
jgi:hypothetical protein